MGLSPEQKEIIRAPIGNILVSAAAGSGKTTVLVGRIIDEIIADKISVDRILVVTFTKEAASNMRRKIDNKLKEKIKELKSEAGQEDVVKRLQKQLDLLPNAYIQTIDSFCTRVIREKGYVIADAKEAELIESGNSILDENTLKIILNDSIMQALSDTYEEEESSSEGFLLLTGMFGNGRTDDSLAENISYTYKQLRSLPDYIGRCHDIINDRHSKDEAGIIYCYENLITNIMTLFDSINDDCLNELHELVDCITFVQKKNNERQDEFHALFNQVKVYADYVKSIYTTGEVYATADAILDELRLEPFVTEKMINGISVRGEQTEELLQLKEKFGPVAALIVFLKPILSKIKKNFDGKGLSSPNGYNDSSRPYQINDNYMSLLMIDRETMLNNQKQRTMIIESYVKLLEKTDENYCMLKGRVRGMDFADQSHLTKLILSDSDAAEYYRDKFIEIYIDEYQDNSEIQDSIIACFERPSGNVFRVGDVKQSIYKFRYANPYMFLDRMNEYNQDSSNGKVFLLNANYRSNNQVLDFINSIFEQIMSREGSEIEYDDNQALKYPVDDKPLVNNTKASVTVVDQGNLSYIQGELLGVKAEVERLKSIGVEYGDICILTRKHKVASAICKYLIEQGHDAVYNDDVAIFDDHDIHGICNVIISVGNIYRDEYLLGVLLSAYRYSNFTFGEVSRIILHAKRFGIQPGSQYLYTQLCIFAQASSDDFFDEDKVLQERVVAFLDWINDLRSLQIITDISELTDRIYNDTGVLGSSDDSEKFVVFKEWLCNNFMRMGSDISGIASELENMKIKLGGNTAVRQKENEKKNAISCMTYHGSKGLEYKAVIVTELLSKSNSDRVGPIKFNPNIGIAVDDYKESEVRLDKSIERFFMDETDLIESNSEGIRLLYVALTRAMEYLSVVIPVKLDGGRYNEIYTRLSRVKGKQIPRQYWLNEAQDIEGAFLAGLIRLKGSSELENLLMSSSNSIYGANYHSDYDDFEMTIIHTDGTEFSEENSSYMDIEEPDSSFSQTTDGDDVIDDESSDSVEEFSDLKLESTGVIPLYGASYNEFGLPVFDEYPYAGSSTMPFKVSVSQIKNGKLTDELPISLAVNDYSYYIQKQSGEIGDSASEVGTFVHSVLRFIDLGKIASGESLYEEEIDILISDEIINSQDKSRAMNFESGIVAFANSSIGSDLIKADSLCQASYEKPIVFSVPMDDRDSVLVQGIIDCIYKDTDEEYVLIDYKTDRFSSEMELEEIVKEIRDRHTVQVNCYAAAMEASGCRVKKKYVFLVRYGEFVEII